jgi:Ca2+-binding EF-hand superfamily protein
MKMLMTLVAAGVVGAGAAAGLVAQNRGAEGFGPPGSRIAAALDADRDGVISADEIRSSVTALKTLDHNGDGRLSADEWRPAFGPGGPVGPGGRGDGAPGGRRGRGEEVGGPGGAPSISSDDLADVLMAFDRNADGKLDRAEVPERFQGLFNHADANQDGVLTKEELKQSATATVQADNDGGRRGGREFGPGGRGPGGRGVDPLLRALDTDGDGVLSTEEIAGAPVSLIALDANHDGRLSAEEFRPAFGRGRRGDPGREERR